jgi:anti-sigma-K factor RskA
MSNTNCVLNVNEQESLLLDYTSGVLGADKLPAYERHLVSCGHCRELVDLQKLALETLSDWEAPAVSGDFDARLFAEIRASEAAAAPAWNGWRQFWSFLGDWRVLASAAAAAIALVFFLSRPVDQPVPDALRAEELAQVEQALEDVEALNALHQAPADAALKEAL